ncbi:MAG TPA: hypothetical protein VEZ90_08470, partial [Blastocatellia bacterium]|nr:hypothetical protein [Blastocatellia bacterium]
MKRLVQLALAISLALVLGQGAFGQEAKNADSSTTAAAAKTADALAAAASKDKAAPVVTDGTKVDISMSGAKDIKEATPTLTSAQEPAASPVPSTYTVNSSAEFGWRFKASDGNLDQFRSDLNYDKGARLFNSNVYIRNNDGGGLFDTLLVDAFGLGGDPSQYVKVDVEKTKWYRFDANYRRFDYFNNLSNFALGQHTNDLQYQVGDFDLTLFPRNEKLKVYLGYSMDYDKGTQFTTYDINRNEFPLFAPTHSRADDYRFGFDTKVL